MFIKKMHTVFYTRSKVRLAWNVNRIRNQINIFFPSGNLKERDRLG